MLLENKYGKVHKDAPKNERSLLKLDDETNRICYFLYYEETMDHERFLFVVKSC